MIAYEKNYLVLSSYLTKYTLTSNGKNQRLKTSTPF